MSNVVSLPTGLVGDGLTVQPDNVIAAVIGKARMVVVAYEDDNGELQVASSHGRPESITLFERARVRLISSYED